MKSKHLAKADFLSVCVSWLELYDLGDFSKTPIGRLPRKDPGFADAGQTVEVVTSQVQQ